MSANKPVGPGVGFNHNVKYGSRVYHVQTEDSGLPHAHYITHLFVGGNIVASTKTSYADKAVDVDLAKTVRSLMEAQHKQMLKRLVSGEFDDLAERLAATHYEPGVLATGQTGPEAVNAAPSAPSALRRPPAVNLVSPTVNPAATPRAFGAPARPAVPPAPMQPAAARSPVAPSLLQPGAVRPSPANQSQHASMRPAPPKTPTLQPSLPSAAPAPRPTPVPFPRAPPQQPPVWQAAPPGASPAPAPRQPGAPLPPVTRPPPQGPRQNQPPPRMVPVGAPPVPRTLGSATAPPRPSAPAWAAPLSLFGEQPIETAHEDLPTLFAEELISEKSLDEVILAFLSADLEPHK